MVQCFRCGTCCTKFQPQISLAEAQVLTQKLHISWEIFLQDYADSRWPGTMSFLLKHHDGACIFLTRSSDAKQSFCLIHAFKPACCRDWKAGLENPECREGLQDNWQLTMDSSGEICGPQDRIENFKCYLDTLNEAPD